MKQVRRFVYLGFVIGGMIMSYGFTVNVSESEVGQGEDDVNINEKATENYGGERTDLQLRDLP